MGLFKCSITGGYVYRSSEFPNLSGIYVFADYCSGEIGIVDDTNTISYFGPFEGGISSLGEDRNNDLYAAIPGTGSIYRIIDNSTLSIEDEQLENMRIYYNEATSTIHISSPSFVQSALLNLYDISGKLVHYESIYDPR